MKTDSTRISISLVIPTFNRGIVLVNAVRMLLNQDYPVQDIVIVDQSTETPPSVSEQLKEWQTKRQIVWIRQDEPNASMARNRGALASTGDVIVFLDDDIVVEPGFVRSYASVFADKNVKAVSGMVLEGQGEKVSELDPRAFDADIGWLFCRRNYIEKYTGGFLMAGNMAVRRVDFMDIGGMDERFMRGAFREESDFAMRWLKSGRVVHYFPEVRLYHLGGAGVPDGGARHWTRKNFWTGWHHYFGSWYFLLTHGNRKSLPLLLAVDLRSAGLNRRTLRTPWMVPVHVLRWLSAFPYALLCRLAGPKLIRRGLPRAVNEI